PPGGARADQQGVRRRPGGADGRRVPQALGLHGQATAPPRQEAGPLGGAAVAAGGVPRHRRAGQPRRGHQPLLRRGRVAADEHPSLGYARQGSPSVMEVPEQHIRVNVVSTVSGDGEAHFLTSTKTMTAALFITFLEKLLAETTGKLFLITDRLSAHD